MWGALRNVAAIGLSKVDEITTQSLASATQFLEKIDGAVDVEEGEEDIATDDIGQEQIITGESDVGRGELDDAEEETIPAILGEVSEQSSQSLGLEASRELTQDYSENLMRQRDETISTMKREARKLKQQIAESESKASKLQETLDSKLDNFAKMQREMLDLSSNYAKVCDERDLLKAKVDDLESEVWDYQTKLDEAARANSKGVNEEALHQQVVSLKELNDTMFGELEALKSSNTRIRAELEDAMKDMNQTVEELYTSKDTIKRLTNELESVGNERYQMELRSKDLLSRYEVSMADVERLQKQLTQMTDSIITTQSTEKQSQEEFEVALTALQMEKEKLVRESASRIAQLEECVGSCQTEKERLLAETTARFEELEVRAQHAEQQAIEAEHRLQSELATLIQQRSSDIEQVELVHIARLESIRQSELALQRECAELTSALQDANRRITAFERQNEIIKLHEKLNEVKSMKANIKLEVENCMVGMQQDLANSVSILMASINHPIAISDPLSSSITASEHSAESDAAIATLRSELTDLQQLNIALTNERDTLKANLEQLQQQQQQQDSEAAAVPPSPTSSTSTRNVVLLNKKLPATKADALKEVKQLREALTFKEQEIADLKAQLETKPSPSSSPIARKPTEVESNSEQVLQLKETLTASLHSVEKLTIALTMSQGEVSELRAIVSVSEEKNASLQLSLRDANEKLSVLNANYTSLSEGLSALSTAKAEWEARALATEAQLTAKQAEIDAEVRNNTELEVKIQQLSQQLAHFSSDASKESKQTDPGAVEVNAELNNLLQKSNILLNTYKTENEQLRIAVSELLSFNVKTEQRIESKNNDWECKLAESSDSIASLQSENAILKSELVSAIELNNKQQLDSQIAITNFSEKVDSLESKLVEAAEKCDSLGLLNDNLALQLANTKSMAENEIANLKNALENRESEAEKLNEIIENFNKVIENASKDQSKLSQALQDAQNQLLTKESELDEAQCKISSLQQTEVENKLANENSLSQLQNKISKLHEENETNLKNYRLTEEKCQLLQSQIGEYEKEKTAELQNELNQLLKEKEITVRDISKLREENETHLKNYQSIEKQCQLLQSQIGEYEKEKIATIQQLQNELNQSLKEKDIAIEALTSSNTTLELETGKLTTEKNRLLEEFDEMTKKLNHLEIEKQSKENNLAESIETIQSIQKELVTRRSEFNSLQLKFDNEVKTSSNLENSLQVALVENTDLKDKVNELIHERTSLKASKEAIERENKLLNENNNDLSSTNKKLSEEIVISSKELNEANDLLTDLMNKLKSKEIENSELTKSVSRLQNIESDLRAKIDVNSDVIKRATEAENALTKQEEKKKKDLETLRKLNEKISLLQREINESEAKATEIATAFLAQISELENKVNSQHIKITEQSEIIELKTEENAKLNDIVYDAKLTIEQLHQQLVEKAQPMEQTQSAGPSTPIRPALSTTNSTTTTPSKSLSLMSNNREFELEQQLAVQLEDVHQLKHVISELEIARQSSEDKLKLLETKSHQTENSLRSELDTLRAQIVTYLSRIAELEEERKRLEEEANNDSESTASGASKAYTNQMTPLSKQRQLQKQSERDVELGERLELSFDDKKDNSGTWPVLISLWSIFKSTCPGSLHCMGEQPPRCGYGGLFFCLYISLVHILLLMQWRKISECGGMQQLH